MPRHILSLEDLRPEELMRVIEHGLTFKLLALRGLRRSYYLSGRHVILLFEKPSTRTRMSFEVAVSELGGTYTTLHVGETQLARGEPVEDFARVASSYADCIVARVKSHGTLERMAKVSGVTVINALSDLEHPVQAVSDVMTIKEVMGRVKGVNVAFVGDGTDNVLNSLMLALAMLGANLYIATPEELSPDERYLSRARYYASKSGGLVEVLKDPAKAVEKADIVYTDVWVSMGKESEAEKRRMALRPYQVNSELLAKSERDPLVMHCLPALRGEEITEEVIEGPRSIVFLQAANRLHSQKGLLYYLLYELKEPRMTSSTA